MSNTIDSVTIPDTLSMDGDVLWTGVRSEVDYSLGGNPIVWEDSKGGKAFDLVGSETMGWIARSVLVSLVAMASVPKATYTLTFEGVSYTVRFRNEDYPPVEAEPIIERPNYVTTDLYNNVRIKLMEVTS